MNRNIDKNLICAFNKKFPSINTFHLNKTTYLDFSINLVDPVSIKLRAIIPKNFINIPPRIRVINLKENDWIRVLNDWHIYDGKGTHNKGELCYVLPMVWKETFQQCWEVKDSTIDGIANFAVEIIERDCRYLLAVHWNHRYSMSNKWPEGESEWAHGEEGINQWKKEHEEKKK